MKKAVIACIVACLALGAYAGTKGSGKLRTEDRAVAGFRYVDASSVGTVIVEKGPAFSVKVTLDENLLPSYETRLDGDKLKLGFKPGSGPSGISELRVEIVMPELRGVELSGAAALKLGEGVAAQDFSANLSGVGSLDLGRKFRCANFEAELSGTGSLKGRLLAEEARFEISGTGSVEVEGAVGSLDMEMSGVGSFIGGLSFRAAFASIEISGAGSADLEVTDSLKARISGIGSIVYGGSPRVDKEVSGLGNVKPRR